MRLRLTRELLDDDSGTPEEIARSLDDIWWLNRHMGGDRSWMGIWDRVLAGRPAGPISLLDVGAGDGRVLAWQVEKLRARGVEASGVALDRKASHLRGAGRVAGDAFHLPFRAGAFDFVTCNLFLHHFHTEAAELLREMLRTARTAVIVNDLERSWWPYLASRAMAPLFGRLTRFDGPASVAQAYTAAELRTLAAQCGAARFDVWRLMPYRLGLALWK